jgi:hypothetical protein
VQCKKIKHVGVCCVRKYAFNSPRKKNMLQENVLFVFCRNDKRNRTTQSNVHHSLHGGFTGHTIGVRIKM